MCIRDSSDTVHLRVCPEADYDVVGNDPQTTSMVNRSDLNAVMYACHTQGMKTCAISKSKETCAAPWCEWEPDRKACVAVPESGLGSGPVSISNVGHGSGNWMHDADEFPGRSTYGMMPNMYNCVRKNLLDRMD